MKEGIRNSIDVMMDKSINLIEDSNIFNPQLFSQVLEGKANGYVIRDYFSNELCSQVATRFNKYPNKREDPVTPPIQKIGMSFYEYNESNFLTYFLESKENQKIIEEIFLGVNNSLRDILNEIGQKFDIQLLSHDKQNASFGILRKWFSNLENLSGLIHEDYLEVKNLFSAKIADWNKTMGQLSVVVCFTNGKDGNGGSTRLYQKRPTLVDYSNPSARLNYGFSESFVKGTTYADVCLKPGDVLFFDSTLLHSVGSVNQGDRITQQCFVNILEDGQLRYWS